METCGVLGLGLGAWRWTDAVSRFLISHLSLSLSLLLSDLPLFFFFFPFLPFFWPTFSPFCYFNVFHSPQSIPTLFFSLSPLRFSPNSHPNINTKQTLFPPSTLLGCKMKSSLSKLKKIALHKTVSKDKRDFHPTVKFHELALAAKVLPPLYLTFSTLLLLLILLLLLLSLWNK